MKILIFTEGTLIKHKDDSSLDDFSNYLPIGDAVEKVKGWVKQGAEIVYLTSRMSEEEVAAIQNVLIRHDFPKGILEYRRAGEGYRDAAERVLPDIIIEDDCASIGGMAEMTYTNLRPELKEKIKSVVVKEFGSIDHLPDNSGLL